MKKLIMFVVAFSVMLSLNATELWENPVTIRQTDNVEWNSCAAETNDGGMIYVWSGSKASTRDIWAQKVDALGNMLWAAPVQIDGSTLFQTRPVISKTSDNNYVIAYLEYHSYDNLVLKAQKINNAGQVIWQSNGVSVCAIEQHYGEYQIVPDNNGGVYVVWSGNGLCAQRFNSSGTAMWQTNGIMLVNSASGLEVASDGAGGFVCTYTVRSDGLDKLITKRFMPDGLVIWSQVLASTTSFYAYYFKMSALLSDSFVITWRDNDSDGIKAQRIGISGVMLWTNPVTVIDNSMTAPIDSYPHQQRIIKTNDNAVIIAWEDYRNDSDGDLFAQKLDIDGNKLWGTAGFSICVAANDQKDIRLIADNSGGCYAVWNDNREGGETNWDVYAQHMTQTGVPSWLLSGLAISNNEGRHLDPIPGLVNNNLFIGWRDSRSGSVSIYYQVVNPSGVCQLVSNGHLVYDGLNGSGGPEVVLKRLNDTAVVWVDCRHDYPHYQLYYQLTGDDGSVMLEPNGRPLTAYSGYNQEYPSGAAAPNGDMVIVWFEYPRIMAQKIDANGNRLWGDTGMVINSTGTYEFAAPKVSYDNGAFYFSWSKRVNLIPSSEGYAYYLYGQKVLNNQVMWGQNGIIISQSTPADVHYYCSPEQNIGRYFIWLRESHDPLVYGGQQIYVKLMNDDGTTATGWPETGVRVTDALDLTLYQTRSGSTLTNAGLFVAWENYDPTTTNEDLHAVLKGQLISPLGERMWNQTGVVLCPTSTESQQFVQVLPGNDIIFTWTQADSLHRNIKMQKYSLSGQPLWTEGGIDVSPAVPGISDDYPTVDRFSNGGMLVMWTRYYNNNTHPYTLEDINYRYINPDGTPATPILVLSNGTNEEGWHNVVIDDNAAYVFWSASDRFEFAQREDDEFPPSYTMYAMKLSNEVVANTDETDTPVLISLAQNYPNPFNPITNISFDLKAKGKITLTVYNQKGQKVKTLHEGMLGKGKHNYIWNGMDENNNRVASGIYLYKLEGNHTQLTKKMILFK